MTWPLSAATKHTPPKRKTHKTITPSHKAPKSPSPKAPKSKAQKSRSTRRQHRSYQQTPTPERYTEIQQALSAKGYYRGEPNGQWGPDSQEALRRFQADQNLTPDGKLGSLSLIALGLGPKRLTAQRTQPPGEAPKTEVSK